AKSMQKRPGKSRGPDPTRCSRRRQLFIIPATREYPREGVWGIGGHPIGWKEFFRSQAKTQSHPPLENKMGPTAGSCFGAGKIPGRQSRGRHLPQLFWLLLQLKSGS